MSCRRERLRKYKICEFVCFTFWALACTLSKWDCENDEHTRQNKQLKKRKRENLREKAANDGEFATRQEVKWDYQRWEKVIRKEADFRQLDTLNIERIFVVCANFVRRFFNEFFQLNFEACARNQHDTSRAVELERIAPAKTLNSI